MWLFLTNIKLQIKNKASVHCKQLWQVSKLLYINLSQHLYAYYPHGQQSVDDAFNSEIDS
jgi:hypothetical protein